MRIVHIKNPANLAWRLAEGQRGLGHDATVFSRGDRYGFPYDELMPSGPGWNVWLLKRLPEFRDADVIHVHGGVWRGEVAYNALRLLRRRPIFVQYNGSEARRGGGLHWRGIADGTFYTDPDIRPLVPAGSTWCPQPVTLPEMTPPGEKERPLFVHMPSADALKGTRQVVQMFERAFGPCSSYLMDFPGGGTKDLYVGKDAELWVLRGIPHYGVSSVIRHADVVFDQISPMRIYGYASVEAMALGRPVLATLDRTLYPSDCPVIFPGVAKLMELARDADTRAHYGRMGREYVERVHDARAVAERVLDRYSASLYG